MAQRTEPFSGSSVGSSTGSQSKQKSSSTSNSNGGFAKVGDQAGMSADSSFEGRDLKSMASQVLDSVTSLTGEFRKGRDVLERQAREYARVALDYGHKNPWGLAVGAAGVGLVLGIFLARSRKKYTDIAE